MYNAQVVHPTFYHVSAVFLMRFFARNLVGLIFLLDRLQKFPGQD